MRPSGRKFNELRDVTIDINAIKNADGSCIIRYGNTQVICTASIEENIPRWMKGKNQGWITAEYGMLPASTSSRVRRESAEGKQSGRTQEIQRLIGRSLRAITDLKTLGERQIIIDCDVIQADGGTRTASITGGYVALYLACQKLLDGGYIKKLPFTSDIAAVSCGIYNDNVVLDLDYSEDSNAAADANFVLTSSGKIIEIQATAEDKPFYSANFIEMLKLAQDAILQLIKIQKQALDIL
jgi:ribonuclease PH